MLFIQNSSYISHLTILAIVELPLNQNKSRIVARYFKFHHLPTVTNLCKAKNCFYLLLARPS